MKAPKNSKLFRVVMICIFTLIVGGCQAATAQVEGPIIMGIGGFPISPEMAGGIEQITYDPSNFRPHLAVGKNTRTPVCDSKYNLVKIKVEGFRPQIKFYYDANGNSKFDSGETEKTVLLVQAGDEIYVCASYYTNLMLRVEDKSRDKTESWTWHCIRTKVSCLNTN